MLSTNMIFNGKSLIFKGKNTIIACKSFFLLLGVPALMSTTSDWQKIAVDMFFSQDFFAVLIFSESYRYACNVPSLKLTWHLKMVVSNRNLLFQRSIFRCYVSFGECTSLILFWRKQLGCFDRSCFDYCEQQSLRCISTTSRCHGGEEVDSAEPWRRWSRSEDRSWEFLQQIALAYYKELWIDVFF